MLEKIIETGRNLKKISKNLTNKQYRDLILEIHKRNFKKDIKWTGWIGLNLTLATSSAVNNFPEIISSIIVAGTGLGYIGRNVKTNYKILKIDKNKLDLVKQIVTADNDKLTYYDWKLQETLDFINKTKTKNMGLLSELCSSKKDYSYSMEEIIESFDKEPQHIIELARAGIRGEHYSSSLELIKNMNYKKEYHKIYEIALEKGWNTYWELEKLTDILENIENKEFIVKLPIGIKRGFRFKNLENYAKHESDLSNKAREIFTQLIERGSRRNINNSVNVLITLDKDKNLLEKAYYLGKKKKSKFFNKMGDLHSIYGDTIIEFLNKFSKKESIGNINKLEKEISKIVKDYFNITTISISEKDLNYVFSGYEKNKKLDDTKRFTAALLMNEDLFSYRSITPEIEYFSEKNIEGIKINIEDKIQDSYDEAIKLLEKENINCKFYTNMMKNSSQILEIIEGNNRNIKDAIEHLEYVLTFQNNSSITTNSITFRTVYSLRDFAFIGHEPRETCLNLRRSNSDCLIKMADNPNVIPLIATAEGKDLKRALLWNTDEYIVIDDIYGENIEILNEIKEISENANKKLAVPEKLTGRFTNEEIKKIKNNNLMEITVDFGELAYSDSFGGRVKGLKKTNCYVLGS